MLLNYDPIIQTKTRFRKENRKIFKI